ncbi:MAG: DUF6174 domain-containing protein [Nocardioides sp.]
MKISAMLCLAAVAILSLSACGNDDTVAIDPASAPTTAATPAEAPTVGSYPAFDEPNYSFTVAASCFCAGRGPVRITVVAGEVADAVMVHPKRDGEVVPDYRLVTIDDVIDAANDTSAASVDVDWPTDQAWPDSVYVDPDLMAVDEEIGYTITEVTVP